MRFFLTACLAVSLSGCNGFPQLTGPTPTGSNSTVGVSGWSPYIVVHTPGNALGAYQETMPALIARGNLKGVRIGIVKGEGKNFVNEALLNMGPEGLAIIDNYYLFDPNNIEQVNPSIEQVIDDAIKWYPQVKVFQIGNELTTILPRNGPQISVEQYMAVFDKIYRHVEKNYPDIKLVTQSTFGSGDHGSIELERMVQLGLRRYPPDKVIIGLNCYSISTAVYYASVLDAQSLRGYRVWVTETGVADPSKHLEYVQTVYPVLRDYIKPDRDRFGNHRIYWYAYYAGEGEGFDGGGWGLIKNINNLNDLWKSPLYKALAGEGQ